MTTSGTNITTDNINDSLEALATTYNKDVTWIAEDFTPANFDPASTTNPVVDSIELDATISSGNISASIIKDVFKTYASNLSRIRKVRRIVYYNDNGTQNVTSDVTDLARMTSDYGISSTEDRNYQPESSSTINASNLDSFVEELSKAISANREDTVTLSEYYCHSSCHSSCHGSI